MSISAFFDMIQGLGSGCTAIGKALAHRLDVPFYEDREERKLGHCPQEKVGTFRRRTTEDAGDTLLPEALYRFGSEAEPVGETEMNRRWRAGDNAFTQLTEEVWTHDHWPNSCNDCAGAVAKLPNGIAGVYYHASSMNLVLLAPSGEKVGIRSTALRAPVRGMVPKGIEVLGKLTKAVAS